MFHLRKHQFLDLHKQKLKTVQSQVLSKDADTFLIFLSSSGVILTFCAIGTQLAGFSISRLANVEDYFNVNIFFKCKLNINVSINNHSLHSRSMLLVIDYYLTCSAISILN